MTDFGVRRLVAINSGNFQYANLDLSKPVHLAAANNRGKTTLVNALQFLYVDEFRRMKFGARTHEDTARHYFGSDRSYLVFECDTPSGTQCLLVHGLGRLRGAHFERFVYEGQFRLDDYTDEKGKGESKGGGKIVGFDVLKSRLANRRLVRVPHTRMWQTLANEVPARADDAPRLNLVPVRKRDEYRSFRDVFVKLLTLTDVDVAALRELIIACHAREIGERRIDVAAECKEEFDRADRAEIELAFLRAVADEVDHSRHLRGQVIDLTEKLQDALPQVGIEVKHCQQRIWEFAEGLNQWREQMNEDRLQMREQASRLERDAGRLEAELAAAENDRFTLEQSHDEWSAASPERIQNLRDNAELLAAEIGRLAQHLAQAAELDFNAMHRQVQRLELQIRHDRRALLNWDRTVAATLLANGFSRSQLQAVFLLINPAIHSLVIGDSIDIKDESAILARLRSIVDHMTGDRYEDEAITAQLHQVDGLDPDTLYDRVQLEHHIRLTEADLTEARERLNVASDQWRARGSLTQLKQDYRLRMDELADYDRYFESWQNRNRIEQRIEEARQRVADLEQSIASLNAAIDENRRESREIGRQARECERLKQSVHGAYQTLQDETDRLGSALTGVGSIGTGAEADTNSPDADFASLRSSVNSLKKELHSLTSDVQMLADYKRQLSELEQVVVDVSRGYRAQQVDFSDGDAEWESLIDRRDSMAELETATGRLWDALFATLAARFDGVVRGVRTIQNAVVQINDALKSYQVSNLRAVEIHVQADHEVFRSIEALTREDGLFHNRDAIDQAKRRLRTMIEAAHVIELESMFGLQIRRQDSAGRWIEAKSLDEIGSTGTGMTAKVMIFVQLIRAIAADQNYRLHFYLDETGRLDDSNLEATTAMAVSRGVLPITADPHVRLEPLAHPNLTVYSLDQDGEGHFYVDRYKTYQLRKTSGLPQPAVSKPK